MEIKRLLLAVVKFKASDLHLQVDSPPAARIGGTLRPLDLPPLTEAQMKDLLEQIADEPSRARVQRDRSADFSYYLPDVGRFRVNVFYERGRLAMVLRFIPLEAPAFDDLGLPEVLKEIADLQRGLVLVTGTTGSGKSTTLAALIDLINRSQKCRIITIEDPIEFVHPSRSSMIAQREIGGDTPSFAEALKRALRQDPDVILVGELRDQETMRTALHASDTGHLVFSTLHTTNASQTVQRLIASFPREEQDLLLLQLSANLEAVISQRLAKRKDGARIPVVEILRATAVTSKLILENRWSSLPQAMANRDNGMQLFDQHLVELYQGGQISGTEAVRLATNAEAVAMRMRGIGAGDLAGGLIG